MSVRNRLILFSILIVLVLPALGLVSWQAWRGMEDRLRSETQRFRWEEGVAASHVANDLGIELFDLRFTFSLALAQATQDGTTDWPRTLERIRKAYRNQAHYPDLLEEVYLVSARPAGPWRWRCWTPEGWAASSGPEGLGGVVSPFDQTVDPELSLENPTFAYPLPPAGDLRQAVVVRFSVPTILRVLVPDLVRKAFAEVGSLSYRVTVGQSVLVPPSGDPMADLTVPLVPRLRLSDWLRGYLNRGPNPAPDPDEALLSARGIRFPRSPVTLSVQRLPRGIAAYEAEARTAHLVWAGALFLTLVGVYVFLLSSLFRFFQAAQWERTQAALLSHELKTPLAAIRSLSENLSAGLVSGPDRVREYGTEIHGAADRLGEVVAQILAGAQPGRLARKPRAEEFDLAALVREGAAGLPAPEPGPGPWTARGNRLAVAAALDNLIANARRYGRREGQPQEISLSLHRADRWGRRWVGVAVVDHGAVLSRAQAKKFLRPRYRNKGPDGLPGGVGLSLVRASLRHFGGRIRVHPVPGGGLAVALWLKEGVGT